MKIEITMVKEATGSKFGGAQDVADQMKNESMFCKECFWALHLNCKNRIIKKDLKFLLV